MTREQRLAVVGHLEATLVGIDKIAHLVDDVEPTRLACRAAIEALTDRAEADRKLGAAVWEAVMAGRPGRSEHPDLILARMADDCDANTHWTTPGEVLRTIIDVLESEYPK